MSPLPSPEEHNPYAPPAADPSPGAGSVTGQRAPGELIKWFYLALATTDAAMFFALWLSQDLGLDQPTVKLLISLVDGPFPWLHLITGMVWIYHAWSGIPGEARGEITPAGAVGRLFIPFYNIVWLFAVNTQLCDIIDRLLVDAGDRRRAPKSIAIAAAVLHLATPILVLTRVMTRYTFLVVIANHALWFLYMLQCDVARRAVVAAQLRA